MSESTPTPKPMFEPTPDPAPPKLHAFETLQLDDLGHIIAGRRAVPGGWLYVEYAWTWDGARTVLAGVATAFVPEWWTPHVQAAEAARSRAASRDVVEAIADAVEERRRGGRDADAG